MTIPRPRFQEDIFGGGVTEEEAAQRLSWSRSDPRYYPIRQGLQDATGVGTEFLNGWMRGWGQVFFEGKNRFPQSTQEFLNFDPDVINGLGDLKIWEATQGNVPTVFWVVDNAGVPRLHTADLQRGIKPRDDELADKWMQRAAQGKPTPFPVTSDEVLQQLRQPRPSGGGGGGRAQLVFDRTQLIDQGNELHRRLLFQEPEGTAALVDQYIRDAQSFWSKGGRLDFETFMRDRLAATDRYSFLYAQKPDFLSEEQYLGQFVQTVTPFGLPSDVTREFVERGASQNVALAGLEEQVTRSPEARISGTGATFAHRFAQLLSQAGV